MPCRSFAHSYDDIQSAYTQLFVRTAFSGKVSLSAIHINAMAPLLSRLTAAELESLWPTMQRALRRAPENTIIPLALTFKQATNIDLSYALISFAQLDR